MGTASLRRAALVKRIRPDLKTQVLRGNVDTRIRKSAEGEVDATLLALAGLKRLGIANKAAAILPLDTFPPAIGQGAVGVTARSSDERALEAFSMIADMNTAIALATERAFLKMLDGSCRTPIAGHAIIVGDQLTFHGLYLSNDGRQSFTANGAGSVNDAAMIGEKAARDILAVLPPEIHMQGE